MTRPRPPRSSRDLWASLPPIAGAALALALASRSPRLSPEWAETSPALFLAVAFAGAAGAFHRPVAGGPTLGLGAALLPPALALYGGVPGAGLAIVAFLTADLGQRLARAAPAFRYPERHERRRLPRTLATAGRAGLAALAAALAWNPLARVAADPAWLAPAGGAAAVYLLTWVALEAAERKLRRPEQPLGLAHLLRPLGLDLVGWALGWPILLAGRGAGWGTGGFLLAAVGLLCLEAARNGLLLDRVRLRAHDLERLRKAGERMTSRTQEMASVAERIRDECAKVLPFHWFQFEALAPGSEFKSWWADPAEALRQGVPEPDRYPPALPGVHRRVPWQILERQLRADGKVVARLRLWCDPRKLEEPAVDRLDKLLPQMSLSVQGALLSREAQVDPLTQVAVRRVLERRLHEEHDRCCEEGGAMAVVLCDLDHFKRINDTFGHPAGDAALVAVAREMESTKGERELVARYGGEEFVLLLPGATGERALAVAERLRRRVEELEVEIDGRRVPLTLSAGVASFPELYVKAAAELVLFADEALYEAKRRGRNRCLLDLGQGRYQDTAGEVLLAEEPPSRRRSRRGSSRKVEGKGRPSEPAARRAPHRSPAGDAVAGAAAAELGHAPAGAEPTVAALRHVRRPAGATGIRLARGPTRYVRQLRSCEAADRLPRQHQLLHSLLHAIPPVPATSRPGRRILSGRDRPATASFAGLGEHPIDPKLGDALEVPQVAGHEGQVVVDGCGRDLEIGVVQDLPGRRQRRMQTAVDAGDVHVVRQHRERRQDALLDVAQVPLRIRRPEGSSEELADGDGARVLLSTRHRHEPFEISG